MENCEYYDLSEGTLKAFLEALENDEIDYSNSETPSKSETEFIRVEMERDIEAITKILKETDFSKTKFTFYNWW